jgi:uncharacterized protein YjiK
MPTKIKKKADAKDDPRGTLTIREATELPLEEISGLCLRARSDRRELLAIGDESFVIVAVDLDAAGRAGEARRHDLRALVSAETSKRGGSQWEAIAADGEGRVFVLQENPGMVFVLNAALESLLHVIELRVDDERGPAGDWLADENSRGEGIVPLGNGHLLIVKEKRPPLFVEFGPRGDRAQGVSPALLMPGMVPLPAERRAVYVALQAWTVEGAEDLADLSDIAVGPKGELYLLSDEERCLLRVDAHLPAEGGAARVDGRWELPKKVKKPEGLVVLDDGSPLVAVDVEEGRDNLFLLAPI